jgi:hypothetical protein
MFRSAEPTRMSVRHWARVPAVVALAAAAAFLPGAGPAHAADDITPTLTSFAVSATTLDVTSGDGHITVKMSITDPDATGVGTGDIIASGPKRGYHPFGHLVQVGGTATNTQYQADITVPAGVALDYRLSISFMEADQFFLVDDLNTQLAASGRPSHVNAVVTAAPAAPRTITFHREVISNKSTVVIGWAPPAAGQPVPTGSTVIASTCGTLLVTHATSVLFVDLPRLSTCTVTLSLSNSAGSSPAVTASQRV